MPRPPRLCSCGAIVAHGTLCQCQVERQRERKARHDAKRPSARQRGYGTEWQKLRLEFLRQYPCCAMCKGKADVVDHIRPHRGNQELLLSWWNLQSLCAHCHNSVKQRQERTTDIQ